MSESMRSPGMRDLLPAEVGRFRRVEEAFRQVCLGWGYQEVRTPTIEHLHLFTSAGTLSPQMLGRAYSFLDWDGWSGERVVLRPDSTIPTARLFVEHFQKQGQAKLFYVQNVFRFAQGDESREDWQCGAELMGDSQPQGDVELILMACEVLQRLGLTPTLKLSDPGIVRAILTQAGLELAAQLALYDRLLDGDTAALDEVQKLLPGLDLSLSSLLSTEGVGAAYLDELRGALATAVPEVSRPLDELRTVSEALAGIGLEHRIAPVLVRNFEYYTGPVFHLLAGEQKLGGGGRYDALISLIRGKDVPASGFALELEPLAALLGDDAATEASEISIRCTADNGSDLAQAFALARALREADWRVSVGRGREADGISAIFITDGQFVLVRLDGKARTLGRIEDVLRALAEKMPRIRTIEVSGGPIDT